MSDRGEDDAEQAEPQRRSGYLTLVARLWVNQGRDGTQVRGTLTDPRTGAQVPIDLTALALFLHASIRALRDDSIDEPPY
jgi:hypothetical protein